MCTILASHELRCKCTITLPDTHNTTIRLCPHSIDKQSRTPCSHLAFPSPEGPPLLDPACKRCSQRGSFVFTLKQTVRGRKRDSTNSVEYEQHDVSDELRTRFSAAVEFRNDSGVEWNVEMDDRALIEALKTATEYVIVERENPVLHDSYGFVTVEHEVALPSEQGVVDRVLREAESDLGKRMIAIALGRRAKS